MESKGGTNPECIIDARATDSNHSIKTQQLTLKKPNIRLCCCHGGGHFSKLHNKGVISNAAVKMDTVISKLHLSRAAGTCLPRGVSSCWCLPMVCRGVVKVKEVLRHSHHEGCKEKDYQSSCHQQINLPLQMQIDYLCFLLIILGIKITYKN